MNEDDDGTMEIVFCPHCGNVVRDGDKFCSGCGARAGTPESQVLRVAYQSLALFTGSLGLHNFYAGFFGRAICQLALTVAGVSLWQFCGNVCAPALGGISGIWAFLEIFMQRTDAKGLPMRKCGCFAQLGILLFVFVVVAVFGGFSWFSLAYGGQ